eukprot:Gregarina_sp_Pseudo_9__3261@NODE_3444_length_647_cov_444_371711_g3143_i0_p1_GENE_NODE_3444_length_647_cov_444_371711_g3143_i0NODE_3444_length_647_cov_444_371711_g3143_i0_p1_ORF_typecomplete_len115_score10_84_NODE_3444_length_647_cov_444_371711_g3143_i043345
MNQPAEHVITSAMPTQHMMAAPVYRPSTMPSTSYRPVTSHHHYSTGDIQLQRYCPPGCVQVPSWPHGIPPVYSASLVPCFMATPEVRLSTSFASWSNVRQ